MRACCDPTGFHAPIKLLSPRPARDAERGGDRLAQADAAGGHDPPIERGHLFLAAAWLSRAQEDRADRARGAGAVRRHRDADADAAAGGAVARERALRRLWPGNAALQGSPRARDALRAHQRGVDYADFPRRRAVVSRTAAQPLSYPVEVPRRGAPALRRDAGTRVPHEGCLFLRSDGGGGTAGLQQDVRGLSAHVRAHGAQVHSDGGRYGADRRRPQPRVHHSGGDRGEQGVLPRRPDADAHPAGGLRFRRRSGTR